MNVKRQNEFFLCVCARRPCINIFNHPGMMSIISLRNMYVTSNRGVAGSKTMCNQRISARGLGAA
jgi:hypothetical protein